MSRKNAMATKRVSLIVFLVGLLAAGIGIDAEAADHPVAVGTTAVDCDTFDGGVNPGDTLTLLGTSRGAISFNDCRGTASRPITIRNDTSESGPIVISVSGSGFKVPCTDCEHVVIDGTGKWSGAPPGTCGVTVSGGSWTFGRNQCGIVVRCSRGDPVSIVHFKGSSTAFTIKGVEVDGNYPTCTNGYALYINDHTYKLSEHPGEWREDIRILNNYLHSSEGSNIYFGSNHDEEGSDDLFLRNNEIAYNIVEDAGCDGMKTKRVIEGSSSIHHNYVNRTGIKIGANPTTGCTSSGIRVKGGFTEIHSNIVKNTGMESIGGGGGITQIIQKLPVTEFPRMPISIYNNVVHETGGSGITILRQDMTDSQPVPEIYNNTVVAPIVGSGIQCASSVSTRGIIRDNIVAGEGVNEGPCASTNNRTGTPVAQRFIDLAKDDFRLTTSSSARNAGGNCPSADLVETARPQEGECDQGAFEYTSNITAARPNPPSNFSAQ